MKINNSRATFETMNFSKRAANVICLLKIKNLRLELAN